MVSLFLDHDEIPVTHELVGDVITIGRDPSNNVVIDDPTVSAQHASLTGSPTGYRLTDLHSTNGTQINGVPITDAELKDGDTVRFGTVKAVFRDATASVDQTRQLQVPGEHNRPAHVTESRRPLAVLSLVGKGAGAVLGFLAYGLLALCMIFLVGLILGWGARLAALVQPWVEGLAGLTLLIFVPVCLLLLIFRKTRVFGGIGIYFASYPVGLALWISCLLYAVAVSVFWTIAGILMGGLGIVPVAAIMTLIRRDWSSFGGIMGTVVVVFVLRGFGAWIGEKSEEWNAEAKNRAEAAREGSARRGNYFARHWRGQLSLGVSYWVNGFLVGFLVGLASSTVTEMRETMSLKMLSALSLLLYAAAIIASLWWSVGVWRSASNHFSRGGTRFWAGVAKVMVIFGFLSTAGLIWRTYIPQSIELLSIIAGDARMPPYEIRVLPGGTEIEFRGGLRAGSAKELERIFTAVPQAKVLHIESPGGRIHEAREMMQLVRKRGLITYTSEECLSAATLVLMSGKERVIAADAKVGFHAGWFPGMTVEQQSEAEDLVRSTMKTAGVSERFIDRVLETSPDHMWYPSFTEMLQDGVVTSQSHGERFTSSIDITNLDDEIQKLGTQPGFSAIRELEPEAYAKMMTDFTTAIRSGKPEAEAFAVVREGATGLVEKYFPAASDEALLALLRDEWIWILSNYKDKNSRACIAMFTPGKINPSRAFADLDTTKVWQAVEKVMRSGASKRPVPIDQRAADQDLKIIHKSLVAKYGNDLQLLGNEEQWMDNSQKVCDMLLAKFQQIAALPNRRAANVVRYLVTTKDQSPQDEGQKIVSLTQSVSIPLPYGTTVLPVGTKLELLSGDKSEVRIRYMGGEYVIPISATDLR